MAGRRHIPGVPNLLRPWNDVRRELVEFLRALWNSEAGGVPAGHSTVTPPNAGLGLTGDTGTENTGWMAGDAQISLGVAVAPAGLSNAAVTGILSVPAAGDHQHKRDVRVSYNGSDVGTRNRLNFVNTGGTIADDAGNDEIDIPIVFGFPILAPDGTGAAPSYAFSGATAMGFWRSASTLVVQAGNGSSNANLQLDAVSNGGRFALMGGTTSIPPDCVLQGVTSTTSGNQGGNITAVGGSGGGGNSAGGDITLTGGAPTGTGSRGRILIPSSTWLQEAASKKILTADFTNATTTFSNLTTFTVAVRGSRKYSFEMVLFLNDSTAADGAKIDFNGGTGSVFNLVVHGILHDTALLLSSQASTFAASHAAATVTGDSLWVFKGSFETNSAGTLIPRAAQNAHTTGTLTVKRGSYILVEDIA